MMRAAIAFFAALLLAPLAAAQGTITTVAGGGPNNLPATSAYLDNPRGVARDAAGNLYIVAGSRVFKVDPAGILTVFAGTGQGGFSGDGHPAPSASLLLPSGVAVAADGTIYIADSSNYRIRKVDLAGTITTVAGLGAVGFSGDGGPAPSARLSHTSSVAVAADGTLYYRRFGKPPHSQSGPCGTITTVAGFGTQGFSGDGGPALNARLSFPAGVAVATEGTLYFVDLGNARIRKVDPAGTITTVAGSVGTGFSGDGGPATSARLAFPSGVALAADGSLYIADTNNNRIRKVDPAGTITTVAGSGRTGFSGDGGPATRARLAGPSRVDVGADGSLYVADSGNNRVRKVDRAGTITTMAGSGAQGRLERFFSGDGGAAPSASLNSPVSVAVAVDGTLYIADAGNGRVRKVDPAGTITTVAGSGREGFSGDNGPAIRADLDGPAGVAVAADGSLYLADIENHRIRKVDRAGTIAAVAGLAARDTPVVDSPATADRLRAPDWRSPKASLSPPTELSTSPNVKTTAFAEWTRQARSRLSLGTVSVDSPATAGRQSVPVYSAPPASRWPPTGRSTSPMCIAFAK